MHKQDIKEHPHLNIKPHTQYTHYRILSAIDNWGYHKISNNPEMFHTNLYKYNLYLQVCLIH